VLISRALSPAKPLNLYIDDDAKHCVAVFDDEEMDSGVGRNYQNINLAAELTGYKIEAVKQSEYEGTPVNKDQEVFLEQIDTLTKRMVSLLSEAEVNTVADYNAATDEDLLAVKGVGAKMLETVSERIREHLASIPELAEEKTNDEAVAMANEAEEIPAKEMEGETGKVELEEVST
jgi:N utilization substance protein A